MFRYKNIINKKTLVLILGVVAVQAFAQYEIKKHTINNGGGKMSGGNYEMNSSIGQVDAGTELSAGNYTLNGGFWQEANSDLIYKNGFESYRRS